MQAVLLLSIVFAPLAFASVEPWAYGLLQAIFFILAARIYIKGQAIHPNPLYKTLIPAILAIVVIALLQSLNQNPVNAPSALLFTSWRPATLSAAHMWLFYVAVLFVVPQLVDTPERFRRLMWGLFIIGVVVSVLGMIQRSENNALIYGLRRVRGYAFGPFVNRDHGAHFLVICTMCGLGLFFSGLKPLFAHQSRTRLFDLLAIQFIKLLMLFSLIFGIIHAGSRGALHSFVAAVIVVGLGAAVTSRQFAKWKASVLAAIIAFSVCYGVFLNNNRNFIGLENDKFDISVKYRLSMYESSVQMLKDFPIFGIGLGAVEHAFPYYKGKAIRDDQLVLHVHSDWIELFLQSGLVGGLIYLIGLTMALFYSFKNWRNNPSFTLKCMQGGAIGAIIAACGHNLVEFGSQMPANALVFYVLIGALAGPDVRHWRREDAAPEPISPSRSYANTAVITAIMLIAAAIPRFVAWKADFLAKEKDISLNTRLEHRYKSLKWYSSPQAAFRLGADIYNVALKDRNNLTRCPAMLKAYKAVEPYFSVAPVNQDLQQLGRNLDVQLAHCYNPRQSRNKKDTASLPTFSIFRP